MSLIILTEDCTKCTENSEYREHRNGLCEKCYVDSLDEFVCGGYKQRLCTYDNCKKCYLLSFMSDEKSVYWSSNNEKTPRDVFKGTHIKYWFLCEECDHKFEISINKITSSKRWCSYCSKHSYKLCKDINCNFCFTKSFASHSRSEKWLDKNINITPRQICLNSTYKHWFKCEVCLHEFKSCIYSITSGGKWCAYCGSQKMCDRNINCEFCFNASFASHEKSKYWLSEKNGYVIPRDIFKCSPKKYWFKCEKCSYIFKSTLAHVTNGKWCTMCKNKTEKIIFDYLISKSLEVVTQKKLSGCKNIKTNMYLFFDFCIEYLKLIIELDGIQHFKDVKYWKSNHENNSDRDVFKMKKALENGYSVYRIVQEDVYKNKYDWKKSLMDVIGKAPYNIPCVMYENSTGIYDNHIMKMTKEQLDEIPIGEVIE